ncbi:MAG: hypothetical protein RSD49_06795 [Hafnia sp.]
MTTQPHTFGFDDYSALAHGIARHLPANAELKGTQILTAMAKAKGFRSTQAFKADFKKDPGANQKKSDVKIPTAGALDPLAKAHAIILESINKMAQEELAHSTSTWLQLVKGWFLLRFGPETTNDQKPDLFNYLKMHAVGFFSYRRIPDATFLSSVDATTLNAVYIKFRKEASEVVKEITGHRSLSSQNSAHEEFELALQWAWALAAQAVARHFFAALQKQFEDFLCLHYDYSNTPGVPNHKFQLVRFSREEFPFAKADMTQIVANALAAIKSPDTIDQNYNKPITG